MKLPFEYGSAEAEFHSANSPACRRRIPSEFVKIEIPDDLMPTKIPTHQPRSAPPKPLGKAYDLAPKSAPARTGFRNSHVDIDSATANAIKTLRDQKWRYRAACCYRRALSAKNREARSNLARGVASLSKKLAKEGEKGIKRVTKMEVLVAMPDCELRKKWTDPMIEKLCKRYRNEVTMRKYGKDCFVNPEKPEAPPEEEDSEEEK